MTGLDHSKGTQRFRFHLFASGDQPQSTDRTIRVSASGP